MNTLCKKLFDARKTLSTYASLQQLRLDFLKHYSQDGMEVYFKDIKS